MKLTSFGGAGTVTGSKHLLSHNGKHILVDCGLFQGLKNLRELNWEPLPVAPKALDAVVLTHAHLDHSGYLPKLVRDGFRGRIYATAATRDVAELILKDSGHLQEKDAEYANRKGFSKHKPALPLYTVQDAERALKQFSNVPFGKPVSLADGATLTFRYAGHILGAATAEIDWGGKRIVFSGDLGRYDDPMLFDPQPVAEADYVVIESTYGNRTHAPSDAAEALGAVIEKTVGRGGTVVIPAFAVGRAQLLLTGPFGHITRQGIARHLQSLGGLIGAGLQADDKRPPIQPRRKIAVHAIGQATFFAHFLGQARSEAATTEHVVAHQQGQVIGVFARDTNVPQQHMRLGRGKRKVQLLRSREVRGIG